MQVAGAGITTVLDAIAIGGLREGGLDSRILKESFAAIVKGHDLNLFRADHALHLRCDVADKQMADLFVGLWRASAGQTDFSDGSYPGTAAVDGS